MLDYKIFMMKYFGRPDLVGIDYISLLLANYELDRENLGYTYIEIAKVYDTSALAVERGIGNYLITITEEQGLDYILDILELKVKAGTDKINVKTFLKSIKTVVQKQQEALKESNQSRPGPIRVLDEV